MPRLSFILLAGSLLIPAIHAQDIENTRAKPADWEEVNFETNQAVIVDGFPSLLRLAELLKTHPDYKVTIVGHADNRGSSRTNDALSLRRAEAVSAFLQKYGAAAAQLQTSGEGEKSPEQNANNTNARFINRRVEITVKAPDGMTIGDGDINSAIEDFITYARGQLGKIDNLGTQIQQLQTQVGNDTGGIKQDTTQIRQDTGALKQDTAAIKQDTAAIKQDTGTLVQRPVPLTSEETTKIAHDAADYALTQSAIRNRKFTLVGFDMGPTFAHGRAGDFSAEIFGKALIPFGNGKTQDQPGTHGLQVEGDWVYTHPDARRNSPSIADGVSDAIFNAGLVNRFGHIQIGTFAQFDYASISLNQYLPPAGTQVFSRGGAFLGAGVVTFDWVFKGGTLGVFGAKGFKDTSNVINTSLTALTTPQYIRYADQAGISGSGTFRGVQIESSLAFVKRYARGFDEQPSGMLKLSFGKSDALQFFIEGDVNTTFNAPYYGDRVVVGFQFGNWVRARNYGESQHVVPVNVPRPHYEMIAR
jgi:hypothetical protein